MEVGLCEIASGGEHRLPRQLRHRAGEAVAIVQGSPVPAAWLSGWSRIALMFAARPGNSGNARSIARSQGCQVMAMTTGATSCRSVHRRDAAHPDRPLMRPLASNGEGQLPPERFIAHH